MLSQMISRRLDHDAEDLDAGALTPVPVVAPSHQTQLALRHAGNSVAASIMTPRILTYAAAASSCSCVRSVRIRTPCLSMRKVNWTLCRALMESGYLPVAPRVYLPQFVDESTGSPQRAGARPRLPLGHGPQPLATRGERGAHRANLSDGRDRLVRDFSLTWIDADPNNRRVNRVESAKQKTKRRNSWLSTWADGCTIARACSCSCVPHLNDPRFRRPCRRRTAVP